MAKLIFGTALFSLLVSFPSSLHAQTGSVVFRVCNAGKTDVDVFLSQSGKVSGSHIGSADCATIASSTGRMAPGYVGIAFVDSRGQWGAPRRLDYLPEWTTDVLDEPISATQSASVRHGASTVTLAMHLLLHPPALECSTTRTTSAVSRLPLGATPSQALQAQMQDNRLSTDETSCEQLEYTLNVEAYPDTKELTFKQFCDLCDKKADAARTPEERANGRRMATAAQTMIAGLGGLGTEVQKELDQEQRDREAELAPPIRVNMSDITNYLYLAFRKDSRMKPVPTHVVIQGTVERVTAPDQYSKAFNVYFKENAKHEFAFCTYEADTFQDVFGADFMTKLAGKTVEIEGWVDMACAVRAGIRVALAHQLRVIGPGVAPAVAKVWSAADYEIPPTRSATPVPVSPSIRPAQRQVNQENSARPQGTQLAPSAQPAPAPKGPAEAVAPARQTTAVRSVPQTTAPAQAAVSPAQASDLGLDDVIQLVKGGMAEQLVIKSIQNSNQTYRIGPAELLKLQNGGVSQRIIEALLETNKKPGAANAPPALAATPAAPAPAAAPQQPEQAPLTAEERKALAQKYSACQQQATRDHPGGGTELVNAYLACNQVLHRK